jgi:hypothetical protein
LPFARYTRAYRLPNNLRERSCNEICPAEARSGAFAFGLATMNPDGTDRHFILPNPVTNPEGDMHQPDWESVP